VLHGSVLYFTITGTLRIGCKASLPVRFISQVLDGAAKPVGGSSEATIELDPANAASPQRLARPTLWQEARQLVDRVQAESAASS